MTALAVRDAYRLWAPTYAKESAVTWLEDRLAAALTPPLAGLRLLDAGCGTGWRLRGVEAASAVGVDLCPEMLEAGRDDDSATAATMAGDLRALPLRDGAFDMVWCRLVMGYLADCESAYREIARVSDAEARLIVTDFHPAAAAAGHKRTFRADGATHEVANHVHHIRDHLAAAYVAGFDLIETREARIGPEVRDFYDRAGRPALYEESVGLPVVLALAFRRNRRCAS